MTESSIRRWLIKLLKNQPIKLQPIESGGTGIGIPDLYFRAIKQGGWIEFKTGKMSLTGEIKLRWEPGQLNWIRQHAELNGKTLLFIGIHRTDLLMIKQLGIACEMYADVNPTIESIDFSCEMRFISRERMLKILNTY